MQPDEGFTVGSPLYMLKAVLNCNLCDRSNLVMCLATMHLKSEDPEEDEANISEGFVLTYVQELPEELLTPMLARHPEYEVRESDTADLAYYMTKCSCGGHHGDHYVSRHFLDLAFRCPDSIEVERLPVSGDRIIPCSYGASDSIAALLLKQAT